VQTDAGGPRFNVLGPVEVSLAGRPVLARPSTQRTLAAALLAGGGRPVPVEALAAGIWEGLPPENARKALIVSVHRLRRALGDSKRITLGPAGYRLGVSAGDCDAAAFGELAAEARRERDAGRLERAAERYTRCLRLWRGAAFADVPSLELIADGAARLDKDRSRASQEHAEVLIDLGMHGPAIDGLEALTRSDPFHERWTALRMLALYRAGRQVEALRVYSETREALREELGLDPGRLLQSVHEAVLRRDERLETVSTTRLDEAWGGPARPRLGVSAPSTAAPRELPAEATGFTGRDEELRELETARLGDADRGVPPSPVVVLSGMAGVGKTATAVHWARAVAEQYPDGQLFLNLRGHSALSPLRPIEALTAMLRSLGLDGDRIPSDPERAAARLRTETAEKRLLVLLDNAASAEQVSPLLPGGRDSLVIVTSRDRLAELLARHGGFRLDLAPLTPEESVRLLRAVLRPPRLPDRPELDELARRSGR
jgi:DNA-binding SARP family transcriptional activator